MINTKFDKNELKKHLAESNKEQALKKQLDFLRQDFFENNKLWIIYLKNIKVY